MCARDCGLGLGLAPYFTEDHDFEGPRSPIAHLDTVLRNLLSHPRPPRMHAGCIGGPDPLAVDTTL